MLEIKPLTSFLDLVPGKWKENETYCAAKLEAYSSALGGPEEMSSFIATAQDIVLQLSDHPVRLVPVTFSGENEVNSASISSIYGEAGRQIYLVANKQKIQPGNYLIFVSPIIKVATGTKEGPANDAIKLSRGLIFFTKATLPLMRSPLLSRCSSTQKIA